MSMLRNYPVVCENKQIGLLQCISIDPAQKRVCALIISCGLRGKRVVLPKDVQAVADGFILAARVMRYKRCDESMRCLFIRDTTGLLTGRVSDYAIDEKTFEVLAIEMTPGYLPAERKVRIWVYAYSRQDEKELIVPACLGSELISLREGTEKCACPP